MRQPLVRMTASFVLMATMVVPAASQQRMDKPEYPFKAWRVAMLGGIAMSEKQKTDVEVIAKSYWEAMRAVQEKYRGVPRDSVVQWLNGLKVKQAADIRKVLTAVQLRAFDEHYKAWADQNLEGQRKRPPTSFRPFTAHE